MLAGCADDPPVIQEEVQEEVPEDPREPEAESAPEAPAEVDPEEERFVSEHIERSCTSNAGNDVISFRVEDVLVVGGCYFDEVASAAQITVMNPGENCEIRVRVGSEVEVAVLEQVYPPEAIFMSRCGTSLPLTESQIELETVYWP